MDIKKINEFLAEDNLPIKFVEWAADYLFETKCSKTENNLK